MSYQNKRIAISYISDNNDLADLYNEEITVDKSTGKVSIKTPTLGNVISYNYHTRLNSHINKLYKNAMQNAMYSCAILTINPDLITLPATKDMLNVNLIGSDKLSTQYGAHSILISIDMDCTDKISNEISKDYKLNMLVEYSVSATKDDVVVKTYEGTTTLDQLNNTVFTFDNTNNNIDITKLVIHDIDTDDNEHRYILNSIMVLVYKNDVFNTVALRVVQQHTNPQYVGEPFDSTGLIVEATESDGTTSIVDDYDGEITYTGGDEGE